MKRHQKQQAFTLVEVLVALVVVAVAFGALAMTQVTNLRASTTARTATETKQAANQVLEEVMSTVLATNVVSGVRTFDFNDFYWTCPSAVTPPTGALAVVNGTRDCTGTVTIDVGTASEVDVSFAIVGESGIVGEGVLTVSVTATHSASNQRLTIGDRVTCYDVYPSPTSTAPDPCPPPLASGGGRP